MNRAHVASSASYTLRSCERAITATTLAAAKAEALDLLRYVVEHTTAHPYTVALRFDGAVHIHTPQVGAGWRRVDPNAAEKKCPRCHGAGITTRAGGVGCFVCGKAGRPE